MRTRLHSTNNISISSETEEHPAGWTKEDTNDNGRACVCERDSTLSLPDMSDFTLSYNVLEKSYSTWLAQYSVYPKDTQQ